MSRRHTAPVPAVLALALVLASAAAAGAASRTMYLWADQFTPASGLSLQSYDREYGTLTSLTTEAVIFTRGVKFPKGAVVTGISFITTTGAAIGSGCNAGLYRTYYDTSSSTVMEEVAAVSVGSGQLTYAENAGTVVASKARIAPGYRYWVRARAGNSQSVIKAIRIRYRVP